MALSNYPPGYSGGIDDQCNQHQECKNGHTWEAAMFYELGAGSTRTRRTGLCARSAENWTRSVSDDDR